MAVTNWLPKPINGDDDNGMEAPLKAIDIRDTLIHYGGNVDNNTASYFTTSANINRWSKHKPIVNRKLFLPFKDDAWNNQAGTAPKTYIGLGVGDQAQWEEIWNGCSEDDWFQYALPAGGESQPLRMGDFRGYRADATSPFKSFMCDSTQIEPENGTATFYLNMRYYLNNELDQVEGGMLSLKDMEVFIPEETYTMVIITKHNGYYTPWITDATITTASWGEMVGTITIGKINTTNEGTYECAVALKDSTGYYFRLPFKRITLTAEIYHAGDFVYNPTGEAYYNSTGTNSYVVASVKYYVGTHDDNGSIRTEPQTISMQFYIGATLTDAATILLGPQLTETVNPGEEITFSITVNSSNYAPFDAQIKPLMESNLEKGELFISANGTNTVSIPLTGA